jgi:hypothetical protein
MRWSLLLLAACGDNQLVPDAAIDAPRPIDAAPIDGPPVGVDLVMIPEQMDPSIQLVTEAFNPTSCAVVEQCVSGPGLRTLLKFDTITANAGDTDLVVGIPPGPGISEPPFTWSPCHQHHHVEGYAIYELLDGDNVVISGHKQAFCLQDIQQVRPGTVSNGYHCGSQGLTAGWADVYSRTLPCQWIDVTGLAPGTYTLRVRINPEASLPDADLTNNVYLREVTI